VLDAMIFESQGVPAIAVITEPFRQTGQAMAASWGVPGYRFVEMPHPIANLSAKELDEQAEALVPKVIARLTGADS
jgi:hypothetical protein